MGHLSCSLDAFARAVRPALEPADFLRLGFVRERGEPLLGVRFAAMVRSRSFRLNSDTSCDSAPDP